MAKDEIKSEYRLIGTRPNRPDGLDKVTGRARYGADMTILIPIFGDQLSHGLSSLAGQDKIACVILMAEVDEETEYVPHHKSKMVYILLKYY